MNPRVLILGAFPAPAPLERYIGGALAERLAMKGWGVRIASRHSGRMSRVVDLIKQAYTCRMQYDCALVEVYSGAAFVWAEMVCSLLRRNQKPYLLALHGGELPSFAARFPRRTRRLLNSAPLVVAPSAYLQRRLAHCRGDIEIIPNPLEIEKYPFRERSSVKPVCMWLRAFHKIYDPGMAVEVLAGLVRDLPDARLTMAGPDKADGSLAAVRNQVRRSELQSCVSLSGAIDKAAVPRFIADGDVFLNTASADNTPVSVIEAMACGLCVVSTNVGGLRDLLTDGQDALLVAPGESGAMMEAVKRLVRDPSLAGRLSRGARTKAESFDWTHVMPKWEAGLSKIWRESSVEQAA